MRGTAGFSALATLAAPKFADVKFVEEDFSAGEVDRANLRVRTTSPS